MLKNEELGDANVKRKLLVKPYCEIHLQHRIDENSLISLIGFNCHSQQITTNSFNQQN